MWSCKQQKQVASGTKTSRKALPATSQWLYMQTTDNYISGCIIIVGNANHFGKICASTTCLCTLLTSVFAAIVPSCAL